MNKLMLLAATAAAVALAGPAATTAAPVPVSKSPILKIGVKGFGSILATKKRKALYYWNVEKRAGGKVRCVGACAKAWPPLIVGSARAVPKLVAGVKGVFGVVRRPDGRLQVTHNRLPVYTYAHEGPNVVLCDNVDGWFVARL
jgi:predicted lipoprotein with Yx(FWY)xxD motif